MLIFTIWVIVKFIFFIFQNFIIIKFLYLSNFLSFYYFIFDLENSINSEIRLVKTDQNNEMDRNIETEINPHFNNHKEGSQREIELPNINNFSEGIEKI